MIASVDGVIVKRVQHTLQSLRQRAVERRKASQVDPVADAIDYCVGELEETLTTASEETRLLTPAQYAAHVQPPVNVQTVRRWIRDGELAAIDGTRGYLIERTAIRRARGAA